MALLIMDGFDWMGNTLNGTQMGAAMSRLWPGTAFNSGDGTELGSRGAGTALGWGNSTLGNRELKSPALRPLSHANNEIIIGWYCRTPAASWLGNRMILRVYSDTDTTAESINLNSNTGNSTLDLRRGTTVIENNIVTGMALNTWYHIEVLFDMLDAGTCVIKIDGTIVYDSTSGAIDLQPNADTTKTWQHVELGQWGTNHWIDDVFIMDGSGTDFNSFLGPQYIETVLPDGDGSQTDWTDSAAAGTNYYQMIDEADVDDDTTYLISGTSTDETLSTFAAMTLTGQEPIAVSHHVDIRLDTAGSTDITLSARSGSTVDSSAISITSTSYDQKYVIHETNPVTAAAWTKTAFEAFEFGAKIV